MTRKTTKTSTKKDARASITRKTPMRARDQQLAAKLGIDAAKVVYNEFCNRQMLAGYTDADRKRDGAAEYGAALDAVARHISPELLKRLDCAHGNALAKTDELAFISGLFVGLNIADGGR